MFMVIKFTKALSNQIYCSYFWRQLCYESLRDATWSRWL